MLIGMYTHNMRVHVTIIHYILLGESYTLCALAMKRFVANKALPHITVIVATGTYQLPWIPKIWVNCRIRSRLTPVCNSCDLVLGLGLVYGLVY